MPQTIAVTGASGFIGRRLIDRLCGDGYDVRALQRRSPISSDRAGHQLRIIQGSLEDREAIGDLVDGVDAVVHLAGVIKARHRRTFFDVNAGGVTRLGQAMAERESLAKLVLVSSIAAREPGLSSYAASKCCGEAALLDFGGGGAWTVLRPPAVYGPGDRETLPFFQSIKRGIGVMLGGRDARFSLIHVDDLTSAIAHVINPGCADGLVMELDDGQDGGHSWATMIATGEDVLGKRAKNVIVPPIALKTLGYANAALRILPGYTPMLTPEKAKEILHQNWVSDNQHILAATDWTPAMPIDRGFRATVDWYQLHKWL